MRMIHFVVPIGEDPNNSLRKLSTFLVNIQNKFSTNYTPERYVTVDEYLLHGNFKQYIRSKRGTELKFIAL